MLNFDAESLAPDRLCQLLQNEMEAGAKLSLSRRYQGNLQKLGIR